MERRTYSRLQIEIEGIFILQNENIVPRDFEGLVIDISEGGFKLSIDYNRYPTLLDNLHVEDIIHFNIPDEYMLFGEEKFDVITGKARILRKITKDNTVELGCKLIERNTELEEYLINRRTSFFVKNMINDNVE